jgi:hypothetical protein
MSNDQDNTHPTDMPLAIDYEPHDPPAERPNGNPLTIEYPLQDPLPDQPAQRPDRYEAPGDTAQPPPPPPRSNSRRQKTQQEKEQKERIDKTNYVYMKQQERVAKGQVPSAAAKPPSATNQAMFDALAKKKEQDDMANDEGLASAIKRVTDKYTAEQSALTLVSGITGSNDRAAAEKAIKTAHNNSLKKISNTIARSAVALVGTPCVEENCPHMGREDYVGLCNNHWKALNRIPDDMPHEEKQQVVSIRKRLRKDANASKRNAKYDRLAAHFENKKRKQ